MKQRSRASSRAALLLLPLLAFVPDVVAAKSLATMDVGSRHGPPALFHDDRGPIALAYGSGAATGADLYAWRLGVVGDETQWRTEGVPVCVVPGDQFDPLAVSDGNGGWIVAWQDFRSGRDLDVYAQHVLPSGAIDPAWTETGNAVCTAPGPQWQVRMVADGAAGAWIVWTDLRSGVENIYSTHLLAGGQLAPDVLADGRPLSNAAGVRMGPSLLSDGRGGAIVVWQERHDDSDFDLHLGRLTSGEPTEVVEEVEAIVCSGPVDQEEPEIASDGLGGAVIVWSEIDAASRPRLMARRLLASGSFDEAWPEAGLALGKVGATQRQPALLPDGTGGVFVAWQEKSGESAEIVRLHHVTSSGTLDESWPEGGDVVSGPAGYHASPRLASLGEALVVAWLDRTVAEDVRPYAQRVLRDGRADAAWPQGGALLSRHAADDVSLARFDETQAIAAWRETGTWALRHVALGAEPPILPGPEVEPVAQRFITELLAPRPNPARGAIVFRFGLASRQTARMMVFDVSGRRVATPLDRALEAGNHQVTWNRRDHRNNPVGSGVYFLRFQAGGRQFTRRFVLIR
jgi:hypothetical protein